MTLKNGQSGTANTASVNDAAKCPVKEAVCIDCNRVYDSCADKDCLEDLVVIFCKQSQAIIDSAVAIKARSCEILNCYVDVESVGYNKGCYAVTCTYFFTVAFDVYQTSTTAPQTIRGLCTFEKKCMLYGADGSVQVFTSNYSADASEICLPGIKTEPVAKLQVVDPMVLASRTICCSDRACCECPTQIPTAITNCMGGELALEGGEKTVLVTLGLFSIVQLSRNVQVLVPAYDYCIPGKECTCDNSSPCDLFRSVDFPLEEFFPKTTDTHCGCNEKMNYTSESTD